MKYKQWRCHRCKKIFETKRVYTSSAHKICDDCLQPIPSQKGKSKKETFIKKLERRLNEVKNK